MGNKILAVVAGVVTGFIVIMLAEGVGHTIYPPPEGFDYKNEEALREFMKAAPAGALLMVILAHALGAFLAGLVTALIAKSDKIKMAMITGSVILLAGIINIFMLPGHPIWFIILDLLVYLPMAILGAALFTSEVFTMNNKVTINKPVGEVWNFIDNPDNMHLWLQGFKEFIPVSGTQGEVGAVSKHVYEEKGRKFELTEEIIERNKNKSFKGKLTHPGMESYIAALFEDKGEATELTFDVNTTYKSLMFKIMGVFMKGISEKRQNENIDTLKKLLEG